MKFVNAHGNTLSIERFRYLVSNIILTNTDGSNYKIIDIPINYNPRSKQEGKKINYIDGIKAIITLLKFYK